MKLDRNVKIAMIIAVITTVMVIIGGAYAFFTSNVSGNETASSIRIDTASLSLVYNGSSNVSLPNALPGSSITKTFTVKNTGTNVAKYTINLTNVTNNFSNNELVYTISSTNGGGNKGESVVPISATTLINNIGIASGETQTYTMRIWFKETGSNQNDNMGVEFSGKIEINALNDLVSAPWYETCALNPNTIGCQLLKDNSIKTGATFTTNTTTNGEYGLYEADSYNVDVYYFRGGDHCENTADHTLNTTYTTKETCTGSEVEWITLNNNIIFGGYCWQIIRTNEDGSIRVIYNGTPTEGECNATGTDTRSLTSPINNATKEIDGTTYSIVYDASAAGYTHGSPEGGTYTLYRGMNSVGASTLANGTVVGKDISVNTATGLLTISNTKTLTTSVGPDSEYKYYCASGSASTSCYYAYEVGGTIAQDVNQTKWTGTAKYRISANWSKSELKATANEKDSTMKTALENWYITNLTDYDAYIEDAGYCNDRSLVNNTLGFGSSGAYGAQGRLANNQIPTFECSNTKRDLYTVTNATGNQNADQKIGLITADEMVYAGSKYKTYTTTNYYLYTGEYTQWTMSPSYVNSNTSLTYFWVFGSTGNFNVSNVYSGYGARAVISLKSDINITGGTGSKENPYIIES